MNLDNGAKLLEDLAYEGLIQVPHRLKTFTFSSPPDFREVGEGATQGISVCLGLSQGWVNGSLYGRLIRALGTERTRIEDTTVAEHGLSLEDVAGFLSEAVKRVNIAYYANALSGFSVPGDFRGVTYQTWRPFQVDFSYILQVSGPIEDPICVIQIDEGNPNGWGFNPKLHHRIQHNECKIIDDSLRVSSETMREILSSGKIVYERASSEINTVVIEGKVMNGNYPVRGVMLHDVYLGYGLPDGRSLGHASLIQSFSGPARLQ